MNFAPEADAASAEDCLGCGCGRRANRCSHCSAIGQGGPDVCRRAALCSTGSACSCRGQQESFPKREPLTPRPLHTHYGVTSHKPGLTTAMFWYVQMSSCYHVLGFVFLLCLLHTSLPPVHSSLLLAFLTTHHPKENSLGLVQQGPLSPLTNEVCWHCNWWSSP